jgi:hypothetical protein
MLFPEKVLFVRVTVPGGKFAIAPPLMAVLPVKLLLTMVAVPSLAIAPPLPFGALLFVNVLR